MAESEAKALQLFSEKVAKKDQSLFVFHTNKSSQPDSKTNTESGNINIWEAQTQTQTHSPQTFYVLHQTHQQQRLLKRYGNLIYLVELKSLAFKLPYPVHALFVQTNVDFHLVATIVLSQAVAVRLMEALTELKALNPMWAPTHVSVDHNHMHMKTAEKLFPGK